MGRGTGGEKRGHRIPKNRACQGVLGCVEGCSEGKMRQRDLAPALSRTEGMGARQEKSGSRNKNNLMLWVGLLVKQRYLNS